MSIPNSRFFRNEALQHYLNSKQKQSLPRFMSFPMAIFLWIILGLCLTIGALTWTEEIPIYVTGPGVVLLQNNSASVTQDESTGAIFLQPAQATQLHAGQLVFVQITAGTQEISSKIERIEPGVHSPANVQQTYGIGSNLVEAPSIVAIIKLTHVPTSTFAGSVLVARVKIGSRRFISFIPGVGRLLEG